MSQKEEVHIGKEKLELFLKGKLTGKESVPILLHLETCRECQSKLPPENPPEVISRLLTDNESKPQVTRDSAGKAKAPKNWLHKIKKFFFGEGNIPKDKK